MISDEEAQKHARKSSLLVAKMKDGTFKAETMENLHDYGAYTSKNMFQGSKASVHPVMVVIDARAHLKINAILHKQFVEHVVTHDVSGRAKLEEVPFTKEFRVPSRGHHAGGSLNQGRQAYTGKSPHRSGHISLIIKYSIRASA